MKNIMLESMQKAEGFVILRSITAFPLIIEEGVNFLFVQQCKYAGFCLFFKNDISDIGLWFLGVRCAIFNRS